MIKSVRKSIIGISVFVMLTVLLVSCEKNDKAQTTDGNGYSKSKFDMACTEEGIFLFEDGLIYYMPAESGEKTVFCFDPVCVHKPASSSDRDPKCMAAGYYNKTGIVYNEGYIYLFVRQTFDHKIYRMDIHSGIRELVAEFPFSNAFYDVVFDGDYAYYTIMVGTVSEDGSGVVDHNEGLIEVSLEDGSYRMLISGDEKKEVHISNYDISNNILLYVEQKGRDRAIYSMNLDTLESKLLVSTEEYQYSNYKGIHDSENFYYFDSVAGNIGLYNINTGEKQVLIEPELGDNKYFNAIVGGKGKIFYELREVDTETGEYFLYDMEEDKTWDITEKCRELGVYSYDPYKSLFLRYELGEDGREILGFMVASETAVLGE